MTPRCHISIAWRIAVFATILITASTPRPARAGQIGFQPPAQSSPAGAPSSQATGAPVSVQADHEGVVALLTRLAATVRANVIFKGDIKQTVTITLHDAPFDQAVTLIGRAAGLSVERVAGGYVIGASTQAIYRAKYIRADRLIETLKAMFDAAQLRAIIGPDEYHSPELQAATTNSSSNGFGGSPNYGSGGGTSFGSPGASTTQAPAGLPPAPPGAIRTVLLIGEADVVERALGFCRELDRPRKQVRFSVKFTSFNFDWLRQFGVQWNWGTLGLTEQADASSSTSTTSSSSTPSAALRPVLPIGKFMRNPLFFDAALTAALDQGNHVLKAAPSIIVIDGERGHILVGEKHLYPKLTGYTQAQTPIYDKEQIDIGIGLDLSVSVNESDDIMLTLYPQVSQITGYLDANGAKYPQISSLEQRTTVQVRDGETIVIGGLLNEETSTQTHGIPGLMNIPLLKHLFTYQSKESRSQDLVILITAEIVRGDDR